MSPRVRGAAEQAASVAGTPSGYHSRTGRVERVVATTRVVLSVCSFLAVWIDPSTPARYVEETYVLLGAYVAYAVLALAAIHRASVISRRWVLSAHLVDLAVFSAAVYLTDGSTSPFFAYFIFAIVTATLRWRWRGALWTGLAAMLAFASIAVYFAFLLGDPSFELNRFVLRCAYLAVVTFLVGYAGYHQQMVEDELARVAAWPRHASDEIEGLLAEILPRVGSVLDVAAVAVLWEEAEEPWVKLASWRTGRFRMERLAPDTYGEGVAGPLHEHSFLCTDLDRVPVPVVVATPGGPLEWEGVPLDPSLRARLGFGAVLSCPLRGDTFAGRLFVESRSNAIADDLMLGMIVATLVSSSIDHVFLMDRLRETVASDERHRLGSDLHDGLLQSLTAVALHLRSVSDALQDEPELARQRLRDLQAVLEGEQRDLRAFIGELRPSGSPAGTDFVLLARLEELCTRVEHVWPMRVRLRHEGAFSGGASLAVNLYRLVHEALINAARHSGATTVDVSLVCSGPSVVIRVADDGRGLSFSGTRTLRELGELDTGPRALRERVARLSGDLVVTSSEAGTTLDIVIPCADAGRSRAADEVHVPRR